MLVEEKDENSLHKKWDALYFYGLIRPNQVIKYPVHDVLNVPTKTEPCKK